MKIIVTGATGNVGLSVMRRFARDPAVDELIGLSRRPPSTHVDGVAQWIQADITSSDLQPVFAGADVVIHLAWLIQPSRDEAEMWRVNVGGTQRVLAAVSATRVPKVVVASSVGAYSPALSPRPVAEEWPTHGIATSAYSMAKSYVERMVDTFALQSHTHVVRLRPGLIFQREAATEIRRFFAGAFLPGRLLRAIPALPKVHDALFQVVHSDDAAEAYHLAATNDVRGAFNIASAPILSLNDVGDVLGARSFSVPSAVLRGAVHASWMARLHPVSPGWVDLALRAPLMNTDRATAVLGWSPRVAARDVVAELLEGMRVGAGGPTPTLTADSIAERARDIATGHGARYSLDDRTK